MHQTPSSETGSPQVVTVIHKPRPGWQRIDLDELWRYRDLYYFLVWRGIKVRYVQSILGLGWAIAQPLLTMIVFTIIFGRLVSVGSDGVPYAIFSYTALVPWIYFSGSVTEATHSLIHDTNLLNKVYFPRLLIPLVAVSGRLIDFGIAIMVLFGLMVWYQVVPTVSVLVLPFLVLLMVITATGLGMWLTALAILYRDVQYGLQFGVHLMMYLTPVVYPVSLVPEQFRLFYAINPMTGVVEGFRSALLGTNPMPWDLLAVSSVTAVLILIFGAQYFRRTELIFADVA